MDPICSEHKIDQLQSQPEETKKEEVTKSKEQLEAERKSIIEQRVPPLNVSGMSVEQLKAKAKELHDLLFRIEGENYDLGQRFKRQSYDVSDFVWISYFFFLIFHD